MFIIMVLLKKENTLNVNSFLKLSLFITLLRIGPILGQSICGSTLSFLDCDLEDPAILSRRYLNKIKALYIQGRTCEINQVHWFWGLVMENDTRISYDFYEYTDTFHIFPYSIGGGHHGTIALVFEQYENNNIGNLTEACTFIIIPENPIPIIKGGSRIMVESKTELILDGSDSIDMEVPPKGKGNLHFRWSCQVSDPSLSQFCEKKLPTGPILKVPAKFVINNLEYVFELNVRSAESDWISTKQIVNVKQDVYVLWIECFLNCPPEVLVVNVAKISVYRVHCSNNCDHIPSSSFQWSIDEDSFDYDANTELGRNDRVFCIKESVLKMGRQYEISVTLKDNFVGEATITFTTHTPPVLETCEIFPETGISLQTRFRVTCKHASGQFMYEIYSVTDNADILLEKSSRLQEIVFVLSANAKVLVKIIDEYEYSSTFLIDVRVEESLDPNSPKTELIEEIEAIYFDKISEHSIEALINEKKFDSLIQTLSVFIDQMRAISANVEMVNILSGYRIKILDAIEKIPFDSRDRAIQIARIIKELGQQTEHEQQPVMANTVSEICKKAAEREAKYLSEERFPQSFSAEILEHTKLYSDCSQVGLIPNLDVLKFPEDEVTEPPTPSPLVKFPFIIEDYPDYVNDEDVSKTLANLVSYTNNLVDLCFLNAKALATLQSPFDTGKSIESKYLRVTAMKRYGWDICDFTINSHNTNLHSSEDFYPYKTKIIKVLFCTSTKNPYWWLQEEHINTEVAILQFIANNEIVDKFEKPYTITFQLSIDASAIIIHDGSSPRNPSNFIPKKDLDFEKLQIYRIDVFSRQNYFVEFVDLEDILNIYVTEFYKPSVKEFKENSRKITKENDRFFIDNNKQFDLWYYLTILPADDKAKINFKFRIYSLSCYKWNAAEMKWVFSCQSSSSSSLEKIECLCHESSVLTGQIRNVPIHDEFTLYVEHQLQIQICYIIFLTVLVVWILYCGFLSCLIVAKDIDSRDEIYFLSDIPDYYRYGYIIIVKTGNKKNAGTTSNISLKIHGKSSESKEHVLNFPDPDKRILQKNQEDWFFLATEYYLGDVEKIELWFDSIGYRPSWYCSEIEVIDLQVKNYWWFLVNYRFEIKEKENHMFTAKPVKEEETTKFQIMMKKISSLLYGTHLWNICDQDSSLSKATRLTVMLSVILTNFSIILLIYGIPRFVLSDCLSEFDSYGFYPKVVWATIIGMISTLFIHWPIVHFLRDSYEKSNNIRVMCWVLLTTLIVVSMTTLLIFGLWVPHITSLLWLTSSLASLLIYIFILENLIRMFYNITTTRHTREEKIFAKTNSIVDYIEIQRDIFYKKYGYLALRPYFRRVYKPLDRERVKEVKQEAKMKEYLLEIFEDIVMITLYVILLYSIIVIDRDRMATISNSEIKDLLNGIHSRTDSEYLLGRQEIKYYLTGTLIHSMQSLQWYGRFVRKNPGMMIDNSNKYIGIARLRQHRSEGRSCHVNKLMTFVQKSCISRFSVGPEYGNFSERWRNDSDSNPLARMDTIWKYKEASDTGTIAHVGKFATYPGGGYVATLGRTYKNSLINTQYLYTHNWLDKYSKLLVIEFLTYSSNANIFNTIEIFFEISTTGFIRRRYQVQTARLLFVNENNASWIIFSAFVVIVVLLALKRIEKFIRKRSMALKDIWHLVDIIIVLMSILCIFLYNKRTHLVGEFLEQIESAKHNEFVKYFHLFHSEMILTTLAAILVFLATLRLWKLLKFLVIIRIVEKTLKLSAVPLLSLCIYHVHLIIVFTVTGFLLFGEESNDFKNLSHSFMSLVLCSLGFFGFDFSIFKSALHYLYFLVYMLTNLLITSIYVTIILMYYSEAQNYYSGFREYNVLDFIRVQYEYYQEVCKVKLKNKRLKGGADIGNEKFVYPKEDDQRYAKCMKIEKHKMAAMRQCTLNYLRNVQIRNENLTEPDRELIKETIVSLFNTSKNSDDTDLFFLCNYDRNKMGLVDDMTFIKMEELLNKIQNKNQELKKEKIYKSIMENSNIQLDRILNNLSIVKNGLDSIVFE